MLGWLTRTFIVSAGVAIGLAGAASAQEQAPETEAEFDSDGFTIESGDLELKIGGRLHLDTVAIESDGITFEDSTDVRRLRVDATLDVGDDWRFKIDGDIGGISPGIYNAWVVNRRGVPAPIGALLH